MRNPAIVPTLEAVTRSHTSPVGGCPPAGGLDDDGVGSGDGVGVVEDDGDVDGWPDDGLPDGFGLPDADGLPDGFGWPELDGLPGAGLPEVPEPAPPDPLSAECPP